MNKISILTLSAVLMQGCSLYVPGTYFTEEQLYIPPKEEGEAAAVIEVKPITAHLVTEQEKYLLPAIANSNGNNESKANLPSGRVEVKSWEYRVGVNDILSFIIWEHPELTIPAGEFRNADASGHRVGSDGAIFFPYVGKVPVAGLTLREIRDRLTVLLSEHIKNPQLDVHVAAYRSQWVHVTGEVGKPGKLAVTDVPMTLFEALDLAGSETQDADLSRVRLSRDGVNYYFDVYALLRKGNTQENILLRDGDEIYVPDRLDKKVYVIGEVNQPGVYVIKKSDMTLADAIGESKGTQRETADARRIFVVRASQNISAPNVFMLDATSPVSLLLSTRFKLQPLDVVYVETSEISRWNRVVTQILPIINSTATITDRIRADMLR